MGTRGYTRQHGLTIQQENAIDLLITGANDTATSEKVGVNRATVSKWRLYDSWFQAELNKRRAELRGSARQQFQTLLPRAIETLARELTEGENGWKAALEGLRMAGLPLTTFEAGPTDSERIVDTLAEKRLAARRAEQRKHMPECDRMLADMKSAESGEYKAELRTCRDEVLAEIEANCTGERIDVGDGLPAGE